MHDVNVIFIPPCQLAYVRMTGAYPASSVAAWQRLLDWLSARGHEVIGDVGFGLAIDDPRTVPAADLRYDACIRVPLTWTEADTHFVSLRKFRGGAFYKTRHVGSYSALGGVVSEARDVLVPREGLIHDLSRAVLTMYYSYPSATPAHEQVADVCIPVLPNARMKPRVLH
jgi:AraC family transcriptional regulator